LDSPAAASTRLTVAVETPTAVAIWRCNIERRRNSTINSAWAAAMRRGECAGLEEASASAPSPAAR